MCQKALHFAYWLNNEESIARKGRCLLTAPDQFIKYYALTCMGVSHLFCDGFNLFLQSLRSAFKCKQPLLH